MATIQFDQSFFQTSFPSLATTPDPITFWNTATLYVYNQTGGCYVGGMTLKQQAWAIYLMTAHLIAISNQIAAGGTSQLVQAATIDKVSVTLTPPPVKNQWQWWLNTTPYGQQLLSLLQLVSVGGYYVGGRPELAAFRRP